MRLVNVIIQCRFSSTRLPGKAMYPLCGVPLSTFLIRRLVCGLDHTRYRIILATTRHPEDDPVAAWAEHEGIHLVRGPKADVLSRYIKAMAAFPASACVRVTADNPLTCPEVLQAAVALHQKKNADYALTDGFPYGTGVDVFSADLLTRLDTLASPGPEREHINDYVLAHPADFAIATLTATGNLFRPELRMTVDTHTDFTCMTDALAAANRLPYRNTDIPWHLTLARAIQIMDRLDSTDQPVQFDNHPET